MLSKLLILKVELVSEAESISSEKLAVTLAARPTPVLPSAGLVLLTVGAVVSAELL